MSDKRPNTFGVSRELWGHPLFANEVFTEREAWVWLLGAAAWKKIHARGNVGPVSLNRGEFSFSVRFLAIKWKWTPASTHRFLAKLKRNGMLEERERDTNHVFLISNYNKFQLGGDTQRDADETAPKQQRDKEETGEAGKQGKKEKKAPAAPVIPGLQFPTWWPVKEWQGFVESRKKIGKPLSDRAVELAISRLTKLKAAGENPAEVLDKSTFGSWTGLYGKDEKRPGAAPDAGARAASDIETWIWRLEAFHHGKQEDGEEVAKIGHWHEKWGPKPGQPGCMVPADVIATYAARHAPRAAGAA